MTAHAVVQGVQEECFTYSRQPLPRNNADWNLGRTRYAMKCSCGVEIAWTDPSGSHRTHVADRIVSALVEAGHIEEEA